MKLNLILSFFLFFIFACSQVERNIASKVEIHHAVFDIDWTLVSEITDPQQKIVDKKRIIEVLGKKYFVNEGAQEFIEEILSHPDMKISFYSGGLRERNHDLLSKIKLHDGRSLKDISYKILSKNDLVSVEDAPPDAPFSSRFKKDLTKISKNLDELIMFDDIENFSLNNVDRQSEKVFFIGTAFKYFETYPEAQKNVGPYVPQSFDEWFLNKNKLFILKQAFNEAYQESNSNKAISFSEAMKKQEALLDLKNHSMNAYSKRYYKKSFEVESRNCNAIMEMFVLK